MISQMGWSQLPGERAPTYNFAKVSCGVGWGGSLVPHRSTNERIMRKEAGWFYIPSLWRDSSCQIWTGRYSLNGFEASTTIVFIKRAVMYDLALHNTSQPFWLSSSIIIDMHSNASIPLHLIGAMQWFLRCNRGPTQCIPVQTNTSGSTIVQLIRCAMFSVTRIVRIKYFKSSIFISL